MRVLVKSGPGPRSNPSSRIRSRSELGSWVHIKVKVNIWITDPGHSQVKGQDKEKV